MKLQGVIILRISDFQRFFDLEEFLVKNQEFLELMSQYGSGYFCKTGRPIVTTHQLSSPEMREREEAIARDLCGVVRNWLKGDSFTAEIKSDQLFIRGGSTALPLGRLKGEVDKYRDKLGFKDIYGLVALYILAGVNQPGSTLQPDFGVFYNHKTGNDTQEDFISLHKDTVLPASKAGSKSNFRLRIFANLTAGRPIKLKAGAEEVTLKEGQCVTGIFSDDGCVTLLNSEASSLPSTHAILVPDKQHKRANLQLNHQGSTNTIPGVTSVWMETGGAAYVTADGKVGYDPERCYNLNNRLSIFFSHAKDRKLLAIKKTENGSYVLYTDKQIEY